MDKIIKSELVCPITQQIFYDPVIAQDSIVYEKEAIQQWFKKNSTSPVTREKIEKNIYEIRILKSIITEFIKQYPEEKANQYKPDSSHATNQQLIENILENDDYYKLLEYDNFSMSIFFTKSHKLFIRMLQNTTSKTIANVVRHIIDNCQDLEFVNDKGNTLVYYLFWYSNPEILHHIFLKNVKMEYCNKFNVRPVHRLCANRELTVEILDIASKYIQDWYSVCTDGITPFREICRIHYNNPYLVKYFIEKFMEKNKDAHILNTSKTDNIKIDNSIPAKTASGKDNFTKSNDNDDTDPECDSDE